MYSFKYLLKSSIISRNIKSLKHLKIQHFSSFISEKKRLHFDKDSLKNDEITFEELHKMKKQSSWEDEFGTLTNFKEAKDYESKIYKNNIEEEDETEKPYRRLASEGRKHSPDWYGRKLEKLAKKGMVYEAIELLEKEMILQDRVRPNVYVFNTLLGILGRVGYTHKAFKIFNMMKKYGLQPTTVTYTSLFNCCSNCPSKQEGLERATKLKELSVEKNEEFNLITYQAIIKAFARCGDIERAFSTADEAIAAGHRLTTHSFTFLFMASVSQTQSGFSLALQLCGMMKRMKMRMDTFHFNLLLRTVRDCGVGSDEQFQLLLKQHNVNGTIEGYSNADDHQQTMYPDSSSILHQVIGYRDQSLQHLLLPRNFDSKKTFLNSSLNTLLPQSSPSFQLQTTSPSESSINTQISHQPPNILSNIKSYTANPSTQPLNSSFSLSMPTHPHTLTTMSVSSPHLPHHRLNLLGGVHGVLHNMQAHKASPNIKTFALLLDALPSNLREEQALLHSMLHIYHLKLDTTFCNLLIRKRNLRGNHRAVKDVLSLMVEHNIEHDIKTYGCLSMGCSSLHKAMSLLSDMKKLNLVPNAEILEILLAQSGQNFRHKRALLFYVKENKLRLYSRTLARVEEDIHKMRNTLLYQEKQRETGVDKTSSFNHKWVNSDNKRDFESFMQVYKQWLHQIPLEPSITPFDLYRQPTTPNNQITK